MLRSGQILLRVKQSCLPVETVRYRVSVLRRMNPKARRTPLKSEKLLAQKFIDFKKVDVRGGNGGDGCMSFMHLFANEWAGPAGGDGGNGAHVIFQAAPGVKSLKQVKAKCIGQPGKRGRSKHCHGANAEHMIVPVPVGTFLRDETGAVICDLHKLGDSFTAARGGAGGKGNHFFLTNETRAPTTYEEGGRGEQRVIYVELRAIADIGMVGFPNVGKSTLLRSLTRAAPHVASYPFTTLSPHIGVIQCDNYQQIAVADIPGIIENAHLNRGLGFSFLRHIERCRSLLLIVDLSAADPVRQLHVLRTELELYEPGLSLRPHAVVGNKLDLPGTQRAADELRKFVGSSATVLTISAKQRTNIDQLFTVLQDFYDKYGDKSEEAV